MTASQLKVGDTFRKQGFCYTVAKITTENYKNGIDSLMVECIMNNEKYNPKKNVDTVFHFKLQTKIK